MMRLSGIITKRDSSQPKLQQRPNVTQLINRSLPNLSNADLENYEITNGSSFENTFDDTELKTEQKNIDKRQLEIEDCY